MNPPTRVVLRRLRRRLTAVFAFVSAVGLTVFVTVLVVADAHFETEQLDTQLRGQASRAAALVYLDDAGRPQVDGIRDDSVAATTPALVVYSASPGAAPVVLFQVGATPPGSLFEMVRHGLRDSAEQGTVARVPFEGGAGQAVAMPWFNGEQVAGVAVAVAPAARPRVTLVVPAVGGGVLLLLALTTTGWVLAGRSLRPAEAALADRERFLATAAHELRGPLTRLRVGAESASRAAGRGEEVQPVLGRLTALADSAGQVVANLLLATRIDHAEVPLLTQPVALARMGAELEHTYPSLVVDVTEAVTVAGDEPLLRHLVVNLVDNALRHGRGHDGSAPLVTLSVSTERGCPLIRDGDDGPGFPTDRDVRVAYVSGPRGGTGLGLPLVLWIAGRHGATVQLGNGPGGGACVEVVFPPNRAVGG